MKHLTLAALAALTYAPSALACGAFFPAEPEALAIEAERILFAPEGQRMHMVARLTWAGEPSEFGWLLPVPADAEVNLASENLFRALDQRYQARFTASNTYLDGCEEWTSAFDAGVSNGGADAGVDGGRSVQVLTRQAVGPYEQVLLAAETADEVIAWLETNNYAVPEGIAARLQPYLDLGQAVLALRLREGTSSRDVQPIRVTYTGHTPAIPIQPTAVSANADTAIIVHVLGDTRAVPVNSYLHVVINDALIDWADDGSNFVEVVSQAVDEAGGHGFVTEYAGPSHRFPNAEVSEATLTQIAAAQTVGGLLDAWYLGDSNEDEQRLVRRFITPPEDATLDDVFDCFDCYSDAPVDGAGLAVAVRDELNPMWRFATEQLAAHPYITRMITTLSAAEMDRDPEFMFNPDLGDVGAQRSAQWLIECDGFSADYAGAALRLPDGTVIARERLEALSRADERRTDGGGMPAARRVERTMEAGQSEVITDNSDVIGDDATGGEGGAGGAGGVVGDATDNDDAGPTDFDAGTAGASGTDAGCSCDVTDGGSPLAALLLVGLLGLGRRRH